MQRLVLSDHLYSTIDKGKGSMAVKTSENLCVNRIKITILVLVWGAGLLFAGSDGPLMPYLNIIGGALFFGASVLLGRLLPHLDPDNEFKKRPAYKPVNVPPCHVEKKQCVKNGACFC